MSFIQVAKCEVPPDGSPDAKICIIGEAPAHEEVKQGKPFVGAAGGILEQCLHKAGLIRADIYITNVFKRIVRKKQDAIFLDGDMVYSNKTGFTMAGKRHVVALGEELSGVNSNVYVPMGNPALTAVCGLRSITEYRGYICESTLLPGRKVIPAIHPAAALRGNYIYRYYTAHDLQKAKRQCEFPEIRYPDPDIRINLSYEDTMATLNHFLYNSKVVSCDIEVLQHEVSCISFANCVEWGVSIPFDERWTLQEEANIWRAVASILESPTIIKVGQNFIFDAQFLAFKMGIVSKLYVGDRCLLNDTMIAHSIVYPDFEKSLRFLASAYTDFPYWKNMVKFKVADQMKKEA